MLQQRLNRIGAVAPLLCSFLALLLIVRALAAGSPAARDEGISAHLFQLLIVAQMPLGLLFLATARWDRPLRPIAVLGVQAAALAAAFGALAWSGF